MIQVTNTENLTGVTISGDWYDLESLVQALHEVSISDMEEVDRFCEPYLNISLRVLGMCYDIRHASQGDHEITTKDNGIADFHQKKVGRIIPRENVYYSCNVLYPEMIAMTIALNELIQLRMSKLVKEKYKFDAHLDKSVIWDKSTAIIRTFQAAFQDTVAEVLSPSSFTRWKNLVIDKYIDIHEITAPFLDSWNLKYLGMTREEREKKLLTVTKRLVEYKRDKEDQGFRSAIDEMMLSSGCEESDIGFDGLEYPEEIEW